MASRSSTSLAAQLLPRTARRHASTPRQGSSRPMSSSLPRAALPSSVRTTAIILGSGNIAAQSYASSHASPARKYSTQATGLVQASVPHRGVVEIKGRDTVKLVQGLVSNDVRKLEKGEVDLMFASFLNPQGRMIADAFIHRLPAAAEGPRWLLDVDTRTMPALLAFIKRFKLRSKVTVTDVSEQWRVLQLWGSQDIPAEELGSRDDAVVSVDMRAPGMGYRAVVQGGGEGTLASASAVGASDYTVHRIVHGVAEGAADFPEGSSVPLENNIDYMNGVDFRKGCYVGQELTARTHHTGVVRKRIIPLSFYLPGTPAPTTLSLDPSFSTTLPAAPAEVRSKPIATTSGDGGATTRPARGRSAGKFTTGIHNLGLGCLRLEQVARWADPTTDGAGVQEGALQFTIENEAGQTILVKPWIPTWWPEPPKPAEPAAGQGDE